MTPKSKALSHRKGILSGKELSENLSMKASRVLHKEKLYKKGGRMVPLKELHSK